MLLELKQEQLRERTGRHSPELAQQLAASRQRMGDYEARYRALLPQPKPSGSLISLGKLAIANRMVRPESTQGFETAPNSATA